jgi:Ser/Thr protein kinase RdoA (MazF antagonist)
VLSTNEQRHREQVTGAARRLLHHYGLGDARLEMVRVGYRDLFRVEPESGGRLVLKMYDAPPRSSRQNGRGPASVLRDPATLEAQLRWQASVVNIGGVQASRPVPATDGRLVIPTPLTGPFRIRSPGAEGSRASRSRYKNSVLLTWVPGSLRSAAPAPDDLAALGAVAARLHGHAQAHRPPPRESLPRWDLEWVFGDEVPVWSAGPGQIGAAAVRLVSQAQEIVGRRLSELGREPAVYGVIHRDLHLRNVKFRDGAVALIDFDMCGWGWYLFDLVVTRANLMTSRGDRAHELWHAFLDGYRRLRPLPRGHAALLDTFHAMRLVAGLNRELWLRASPKRAAAARGEQFVATTLHGLGRFIDNAS